MKIWKVKQTFNGNEFAKADLARKDLSFAGEEAKVRKRGGKFLVVVVDGVKRTTVDG